MLQQGKVGEAGLPVKPLHLFSNGAQIFVGTRHSDLGLHAWQGKDGNLYSLGYNEQ